MLENIEVLSDIECISVVISKGNIIMVFGGSYQPNMDNNIG